MPQLSWSETSYDIEAFYSANDAPSGTLAITTSGSLEEIEKVLVPTKVAIGTYKVEVKRIDTDLYEISGKNIYIKTQYCYEYSYGDEVVLEGSVPAFG